MTTNTTIPDRIQELAAQETEWTIPEYPHPVSPSWAAAFASASERGKRNLANAWVWCVNTHLDSLDSTTQQLNWLRVTMSDAYRWVRQMQGYVNTAQFRDYQYDGSLDNLLGHFFEEVGLLDQSEQDTFTEALRQLWFGHGDERVAGLTRVFQLMYCEDSLSDLPGMGKLLANLAWEVAASVPDDEQLQLYATAFTMDAASRLIAPRVHGNPYELAWHRLAYANLVDSAVLPTDDINAAVQQLMTCPPNVLLAFLPQLYTGSMRVKRGGGTELNPLSSLGTKLGTNATYRDVLTLFMPQYAACWTAAEALGLDYRESYDLHVAQPGVLPVTMLPPQLSE